MTLLACALIAVMPVEMAGFWHSEPDMDAGLESGYCFWEEGTYAWFGSLDSPVEIGAWWTSPDGVLLLEPHEAIWLDGTPADYDPTRYAMRFEPPPAPGDPMMIGGESFFLLEEDPEAMMLSLVPSWGMSDSERDTFSTYD